MEGISYPMQFLISFPEAALLALLGLSILGIKPTGKQILLIGFIQAGFGAYVRWLPWPFGVHTILQIISLSLLIYLVMLIPLKLSFLAVLSGFCIYISVEAVLLPISLALTGLSLPVVLQSFWLQLAFWLPQAVTVILIIILICRNKVKLTEYYNIIFQSETIAGKNPSTQISKSFPLICLFLIQNFLIALFYWISYARVNDPYISDTLTPVPFPISLIIPLLLVAAVIMIKRVLRLIQNEIETKTQLNSLRHVEELLHTIRAQRHNFSHELQVVYGLLEVEAFQEAREYIRGSMAEIAATSEIIKTDNLGITALLQTKTGLAEAGKIKFNIEVKTSLQDLPLESRDASIIIGNLIDNALDAVKGLIPEQRRVDIVLARDLAGYVIDVKNCGPAIKPELIEKIFAPEFSTKGEGRGMGLYSVKNLVEKYKGEIRVSSEPGCTCFRVLIPHRN